ncbi:MAG TPA: FAD:protein FMN transferase [Gammaproteobacteria bacterium]|nr:FAD:protein FMN transferase [Gammaproteobacteria bacterium]
MRRVRSRLAAAVLVMLLAGCDAPPEYREQFLGLHTLVDVSFYDVEPATARAAVAAIEEEFARLDRDFGAWNETGALGRLNRALEGGGAVPITPELAAAIGEATELSRRTGGLFNPAIGRLVELWGFHVEERAPSPPPAAAAIAALVAGRPQAEDFVIENGAVRRRNPAARLDFGAYAKGLAVNHAIALLRARGIANAIVNAGGDLRAIGRHGERPWRIGIRHPRGAGIFASVEIEGDTSVFTSGDYERFFIHDGVRYHHIIDPRTGYPARGFVSATVIHSDATLADAAATALIVAGPAGWRPLATALGLEYVMLIDETGAAHLTPAMAHRVRFETDPAPRTVIVP